MNTRHKFLILILVSTLFIFASYSLFSKAFLISGFAEVERDEELSDTAVLLETFNSMVAALDSKTSDWAAWDESYKYVQRKNKSFEKANFLPETMKLLNLDYFAFFDKSGHVVGHRAFDKKKSAFVNYPQSLERVFSPGAKLFMFDRNQASHRGVLKLPEGLVMFALRPVYDSKMRSPSKGFILTVRKISDETAATIGEITHNKVTFEDPEKAETEYGLNLQKVIEYKEISNEMALGIAVLNDFYNIPVAVIKTEIPRKIMQIGMASYRKTMTFITFITAVIALIILFLFDRTLLRRLTDLDEQVNLLDEKAISQLTVKGNDEITRLANSMNQMLGALHARNSELLGLNEIIKNQNHALVSAAKMSALGEMAGGVAHEINTPLTVIKLRSEMILDEINEISPANQKSVTNSLVIIDKTVDRITKIVQSLRTFSRETSEQEKIEYSVSAIVSEALNLCHEKFKIHGIDLQIDIAEDFVLLCRPTEIAQVLINLLNNAYDAIENCDQKIVSVRTLRMDDHMIEISVTDTGKGIPPEIQDKIMQPFFTTKEFGKGTGIGLSISKGIAETHGGKLYLDRCCRQTRIVMILPFVRVIESKTETAA